MNEVVLYQSVREQVKIIKCLHCILSSRLALIKKSLFIVILSRKNRPERTEPRPPDRPHKPTADHSQPTADQTPTSRTPDQPPDRPPPNVLLQ